MSKYWLLFALCGTIGACALSPAEDTETSNDAVQSTDANKGKGQGTHKTGDKGTGKTGDKGTGKTGDKDCPGSSGSTDLIGACKQLLAVVQANIDTAAAKGDQNQILALKEKYTVFWNECAKPVTDPGKPNDPVDPCAQALKEIELQINAAAKAGDNALVTALKEKYSALASSCVPPTNPGDQCTQTLQNLQLQIDAAAKAGDNALVAALKEKYLQFASSCTPTPTPADQCAQTLKTLQMEIDAAIKAGDSTLVALLKQKYEAFSASCASAGKDAPPPDKK